MGEACFYLGVCEYQLKRFAEAADAFSQAATRATGSGRGKRKLSSIRASANWRPQQAGRTSVRRGCRHHV